MLQMMLSLMMLCIWFLIIHRLQMMLGPMWGIQHCVVLCRPKILGRLAQVEPLDLMLTLIMYIIKILG